jgi:H+/Cl- antiporter ClcA
MWYSEGELTDPADGAVLADTGKIDSGNNTLLTVLVTASVAAAVMIVHRDAANTGTVIKQIVRVVPNDTKVVPLGVQPLGLGERFQVLASGVTVGAVQASIIY